MMRRIVGTVVAAGILASLGYGPAAYAACGATLQAEATAVSQAVEQAKAEAKATTVEWHHGVLADGSEIRAPSKESLVDLTDEFNATTASETIGEKTLDIVKGMFRALLEAIPQPEKPQYQIGNIGVQG
jgi:hypothetical protein